jgi:hypothetical protein
VRSENAPVDVSFVDDHVFRLRNSEAQDWWPGMMPTWSISGW